MLIEMLNCNVFNVSKFICCGSYITNIKQKCWSLKWVKAHCVLQISHNIHITLVFYKYFLIKYTLYKFLFTWFFLIQKNSVMLIIHYVNNRLNFMKILVQLLYFAQYIRTFESYKYFYLMWIGYNSITQPTPSSL